jgi:hypothetical protein
MDEVALTSSLVLHWVEAYVGALQVDYLSSNVCIFTFRGIGVSETSKNHPSDRKKNHFRPLLLEVPSTGSCASSTGSCTSFNGSLDLLRLDLDLLRLSQNILRTNFRSSIIPLASLFDGRHLLFIQVHPRSSISDQCQRRRHGEEQ